MAGKVSGIMSTVGKVTWFTIRLLCVLATVLIAFAFAFLFLIGPAMNNAQLRRGERELLSHEMPAGTVFLESNTAALNTGNGNDIELWVGMLVLSDLSEYELSEYFGDYTVTDVAKVNLSSRLYSRLFNFEKLNNKTVFENLFVIHRFVDAATQFDLRGGRR